jgi:hypothetical protein
LSGLLFVVGGGFSKNRMACHDGQNPNAEGSASSLKAPKAEWPKYGWLDISLVRMVVVLECAEVYHD